MSFSTDLIGGPMYPLSNPKKKKVFEEGWGEELPEDDGFAALVRVIHERTPFDFGHCYSNADKVVTNGWGNGWRGHRLIPYAGWIAFDNDPDYWIHHAWAVLDDKHLIDMGCCRMSTVIDKKMGPERDAMRKEMSEAGKSSFEFAIAWRLKYCEVMKAFEDGDVVENRVWGKVPPRMTYAGDPCGKERAVEIYNKWNETTKRDDAVTPTQLIAMLIKKGLSAEAIQKVVSEMAAEEK